MRVLVHSGLVIAKRNKQWTFDQRDERRIREVKKTLAAQV
jgi:hypothetical protein